MTEQVWDVKPSLEDLAHHGVKGMHWGVRKEGDSEGGGSGSSTLDKIRNPNLTEAQKKAAVAATIAVGVAATALILHHYGASIPSQQRIPSVGELVARDNAIRSGAQNRATRNAANALARNVADRSSAQKQAALNTAQALGRRRDELGKAIDYSSRQGLLDLPSTQALLKEHGEISTKYLQAPYATKSQLRTLKKLRP